MNPCVHCGAPCEALGEDHCGKCYRRLGVQPHPMARAMIADACEADRLGLTSEAAEVAGELRTAPAVPLRKCAGCGAAVTPESWHRLASGWLLCGACYWSGPR